MPNLIAIKEKSDPSFDEKSNELSNEQCDFEDENDSDNDESDNGEEYSDSDNDESDNGENVEEQLCKMSDEELQQVLLRIDDEKDKNVKNLLICGTRYLHQYINKTRSIWCYFLSKVVDVPLDYADLIEEMWKNNIETYIPDKLTKDAKCMKVTLSNTSDIQRIYDILFYGRKYNGEIFFDEAVGKWKFSVCCFDINEDNNDDESDTINLMDKIEPRCMTDWIFPKEHYNRIVTRFREHMNKVNDFVSMADDKHIGYIKKMLNISNCKYINTCNEYDYNAFMSACCCKSMNVANYLLVKGADINFKNSFGINALMMIMEHKIAENEIEDYKKVIDFLIEKGINLNEKNSDNMTVLDIAKEHNNDKIIEYLKEKGLK